MKTQLALIALAGLLLAGCTGANAPLGQSIVRTSVSTGVAIGTAQHPEATPYVRTASLVICAAANQTNVQPAQIVANLEAAGVGNDVYAKLIVNGVLGIYTSVYEYYGSAIGNEVVLLGYLKAVCDGMNDGLPPATAMSKALAGAKKPLPPHLK